MDPLGQISWDVARAGGFTAYIMLTASIALGLALSMGWRSATWPRFVTKEVHQFVTLLTLLFLVVHGLAVWVDPFTKFTPAEVLVPLASHYRPLWMAIGIVGAYLLVALWLTEYVRPWIGYSWWRRLHYLTMVTYVLASVHGLATGSDTRTGWAWAIYVTSFALVGTLLVSRLVSSSGAWRARILIAGAAAALGVSGWSWAMAGPLQSGWNVIANNGHGSGDRITTVSQPTTPTPSTPAGLALPFQATVTGTVSESANSELMIALNVEGDVTGSANVGLVSNSEGAVDPTASTFTLSDATGRTLCHGHALAMIGSAVTASCQTSDGRQAQIQMNLLQRRSVVSGTMTGASQGSTSI